MVILCHPYDDLKVKEKQLDEMSKVGGGREGGGSHAEESNQNGY